MDEASVACIVLQPVSVQRLHHLPIAQVRRVSHSFPCLCLWIPDAEGVWAGVWVLLLAVLAAHALQALSVDCLSWLLCDGLWAQRTAPDNIIAFSGNLHACVQAFPHEHTVCLVRMYGPDMVRSGLPHVPVLAGRFPAALWAPPQAKCGSSPSMLDVWAFEPIRSSAAPVTKRDRGRGTRWGLFQWVSGAGGVAGWWPRCGVACWCRVQC